MSATNPRIPMIGKTFNELTVIEIAHMDNVLCVAYKCRCSCGAYRIVEGTKLRNGYVKRCADCAREYRYQKSSALYKEQLERKGKTYYIWQAIRQRCNNPNNKWYKDYGDRGIKIEDASWYVYENFHADMGDAPQGYQMDRIDNDKGYYKENCRWTTPKINTNNRRKLPFRKHNRKKKTTNISMNGGIAA